MRRWGLLLDRISPWHRGHSEGWDAGIHSAAPDLEILLEQYDVDPIPRAQVQAVVARLRAELDY